VQDQSTTSAEEENSSEQIDDPGDTFNADLAQEIEHVAAGCGIRALSATSGRFVTLPQRTAAVVSPQQQQARTLAAVENNGGDDLEDGMVTLELENNSSETTVNYLTSAQESFHN
jgi:hypothetical protein